MFILYFRGNPFSMLSINIKKISLPGGTDAWKNATWIFLLSRFVIFVCTYLAWSRFVINNPQYAQSSHECLRELTLCLQSWNVFDARHFATIAHYGYGGYPPAYQYPGYSQAHPWETAFFPLFPLLMRVIGFLFGGSLTADYFAGLLVANLCFFFAMIVLYRLVRDDF